MDTNQAITMIEGLITQATVTRDAQQALIDGYNVILGILQGTLKTQLDSVTLEQLSTLKASLMPAAEIAPAEQEAAPGLEAPTELSSS